MSGAVLVGFSSLDLPKFLSLGRQAFGRSLSEAADSINSNPPLQHMLSVAAMKEPHLKPSAGACIPYLNLFHASFVLVADERDMAEIFEITGMPVILCESQERGMAVSYAAGTLDQWKTAMLRGCIQTTSREARHMMNMVYSEFNKRGLAPIFEVRKTSHPSDQTFLLEHKK